MSDIEGFFKNRKDPLTLSAREMEVVELVVQGWDNAEMARQLLLGVKTVEHHLSNIYHKVEVKFDCSNRNMRSYLGTIYRELNKEED